MMMMALLQVKRNEKVPLLSIGGVATRLQYQVPTLRRFATRNDMTSAGRK
jgi:hypothetical protein